VHSAEFLGELGLVLGAALIGGLVARALRLPVLIGYLLAGLVIGPHTPGITADDNMIRTVAEFGVALLMFAVGVQFSLEELNHVRRTALVGGILQILGTIVLGMVLGLAFGWGVYGGLFLGCALALSSTAVMLKILEERGEMGSPHGNVMLGILVVQDLSMVMMIVLLPALSTLGDAAGLRGALAGIGAALLKAALFLGATLLLATRGVPALLDRVARTGSRELFLLTVVCLCLAAAFAAERMGLGLALGAFLAGIVVSESDFSHEVFSQVRPLRDVFASLFFVSVGMLLNPRFLAENIAMVTAVVLVIVGGKSLWTMFLLRGLGWPGRTILRSGLGLAQIGEFSFVLATVGAARGLIGDEISGVILASALITILLTPLVYGSAAPLYRMVRRSPVLSGFLERRAEEEDAAAESAHAAGAGRVKPGARVIILGIGRVGRYVSDALRAKEVAHVVVDFDASQVERLRSNGVSTIYGDATSEAVLAKTHPHRAELAMVALPDADASLMTLRALKQMAPDLPVVVRVQRGIDIPRVRAAGADAVIHAEFEAGTEMIRQGLDRLGLPDPEVDAYIEKVRQHRYRQEA